MDDWDNEKSDFLFKEEPKPISISGGSLIWLLLIVISGVTIGNLSSNFITAKYAEVQLAKATKEFNENLEKEAAKLKAINTDIRKRKQVAAENSRKKAELVKKQRAVMTTAQRQKDDTCNFWISEYKKDKSEFSLAHRNVACRDAGRAFNK